MPTFGIIKYESEVFSVKSDRITPAERAPESGSLMSEQTPRKIVSLQFGYINVFLLHSNHGYAILMNIKYNI